MITQYTTYADGFNSGVLEPARAAEPRGRRWPLGAPCPSTRRAGSARGLAPAALARLQRARQFAARADAELGVDVAELGLDRLDGEDEERAISRFARPRAARWATRSSAGVSASRPDWARRRGRAPLATSSSRARRARAAAPQRTARSSAARSGSRASRRARSRRRLAPRSQSAWAYSSRASLPARTATAARQRSVRSRGPDDGEHPQRAADRARRAEARGQRVFLRRQGLGVRRLRERRGRAPRDQRGAFDRVARQLAADGQQVLERARASWRASRSRPRT